MEADYRAEVCPVQVILHPMVVHFPIALLVTGLGFELYGLARKEERFRQLAGYLLVLGWLGLLAAVATGFLTGEAGEGFERGEAGEAGESSLVESHQRWAYASVAVFGLYLVVRGRVAGLAGVAGAQAGGGGGKLAAALLLAVLGLVTLVQTGHTGGTLVYGPVVARESRERGEGAGLPADGGFQGFRGGESGGVTGEAGEGFGRGAAGETGEAGEGFGRGEAGEAGEGFGGGEGGFVR